VQKEITFKDVNCRISTCSLIKLLTSSSGIYIKRLIFTNECIFSRNFKLRTVTEMRYSSFRDFAFVKNEKSVIIEALSISSDSSFGKASRFCILII